VENCTASIRSESGNFKLSFLSLSVCVGVLSTEITQRFRHLLVLSLYLVGKLVFRVVP